MAIQTHIPPDSPALCRFGHDTNLPVDEADAWPDLRHRDLTQEELAILRPKVAQLFAVADALELRLACEEEAMRADLDWSAQPDRGAHIPGMLVSFIRIPLKVARDMLDEGRGDEVAVAHLRLAEALVRLMATWRGAPGDGLVKDYLRSARSPEPVAAVSNGGTYTPPRFVVLGLAEHEA